MSPDGAEPGPGLLVVDKPGGMTSHDVVARVRRLVGTRRVGHGGTLDPLATGVLVVGIGRATRLLGYLQGHDKSYAATFRLGSTTSSDDAEGEVVATADTAEVTDDAVRAGLRKLTGSLAQLPPAVSAVQVGGVRSYAAARRGEALELQPRQVLIHALELEAMRRDGPFLDLDVAVRASAGTYVRALARDLGAALGVGGHVTALRRTASGPFTLADAGPLDDTLPGRLLPLTDVALRAFPRWDVDADDARRIGFGQKIAAPEGFPAGPVAVLDPAGELVALAESRDGVLRCLAVFTG